jgi:signal transduction histidine kinase
MDKFYEVANQLANTVQNLSEVVNINQSSEIQKDEIRFETLLQNLMTSLITQITEIEADVKYDFSRCEKICYPPIYLESILLNLLTNALKYSSPNRRPEITFTSYKQENGLIILECKDNGLGIDLKKYGSKVFALNKTFHDNPDARGIGLFITKHQIRSLGGSIAVESEPDKGSTFTIKFNEIEVL